MKNAFMILAVLIVALASAPTKAAEGNDGVHIVPLESRKAQEGYELRPGQFHRGTKFSEEPRGWKDGDPCWHYTYSDDNRGGERRNQVWEFVCD